MVYLVGGNGLLGKEMGKRLTQCGMEWVGGESVDITLSESIDKFLANNVRKIKWIINCAAYTDVDAAEGDEELAAEVNALGCLNLGRAARANGMRLVHISTNYVFDGKKSTPYTEEDNSCPINAYGRTKLQGEENIAKEMTQYYIIRTACLYGADGGFAYKMMQRLKKTPSSMEAVRVVNDQMVCPTFAGDVADVVIKLIRKADEAKTLVGKDSPAPYGIYHFCSAPAVSVADYAQAILELGKKYGKITGGGKIAPCTTSQYEADKSNALLPNADKESTVKESALAKRPQNGALDCTKITKVLGSGQYKIRIPNWKHSLEAFMKGGE